MAGQFWKKRLFKSVLTIAGEMTKTKGKNPDKMCQLIFLEINPQKQKQWHKNPLYIYWECQTIFKTSQYLFVASLYWSVYFKVFLKKHDFARLISSLKKFQEIRIKSLFLSFQKLFSKLFSNISRTTWPKLFIDSIME